MTATMIKKLSVKTISGDVKKFVLDGLKSEELENGQRFDIFSVVGIIKKVTEGEHDQYGTYYEFGGSFEGIRLIDGSGQTFRAAKCFLPEVATELLVAEHNRICEENDGEAQPIQIALKVSAVVDETLPTMFSYEVTPLIKAEENDPLAMIKQQAGLMLENKG